MNAEPSETLHSNVIANADAPDGELWMALKQGQVEALGRLYDRHGGLVYAIALKTLNNPQDAEDLTQDIFLRLAQTAYDPNRGSLRTFLAILTRSRGIDRVRSRQRMKASLDRWQGGQVPTATDAPAEALVQAEQVQAVQTALAQLSENQQRVLRLAYHDGLSQSAIAEQLGTPLGTVKAWARRGLLKLRQSLQDTGLDE